MDNVKYKNDFNREKYDRVGLMLPKGKGAEWKAEAERRNMSLNAFIQTAVKEYLDLHKDNLKLHNTKKCCAKVIFLTIFKKGELKP